MAVGFLIPSLSAAAALFHSGETYHHSRLLT
jgi:hypothetical protein